jgi:predicted transcriptional regulator
LEISGGELEDSQALTETAEHPTAEGHQAEESQSAFVPDIEPSESIHEQEIICMECGKGFKQLTPTHLKKHNLTASRYREKYGFRNSQPLAARASTEKRRSLAEQLGTGQRLKMAREAKKSNQ